MNMRLGRELGRERELRTNRAITKQKLTYHWFYLQIIRKRMFPRTLLAGELDNVK